MKIAIVIPTYNRAAMACHAVESALAQRMACRVVVVDDGSDDDTRDRMATFGRSITYLYQQNRERGAARNRGVAVAEDSDLICFLDADDRLTPDHAIEMNRLAIRHPNATFFASGALLVREDGSALRRVGGTGAGPITISRFLAGAQPVSPTMMGVARRRFVDVGGFAESREIAGSEDWLLVARLLIGGPAVRGGMRTAELRIHSGNTATDPERMHKNMLRAHEELFRHPAAEMIRNLEGRSKSNLLIRSAVGFYAAGEMRLARRLLIEAMVAWPHAALDPLVAWTGMRTMLGGRLTRGLRAWKDGRSHTRAAGAP